MDVLPFTDDIHKRSASFSTADSTFVGGLRSIAEFVIVGHCRTAGWNCFSMATAVWSSVELVMASVLRRTSPTYVASSSSSLDAVAGVGPYGESMACRQRRRVSCSRHCSAMVRNVQGWYETSVVRRVRKIHGWYEKSMVRNVYGTNSLWYEKSGSQKTRSKFK